MLLVGSLLVLVLALNLYFVKPSLGPLPIRSVVAILVLCLLAVLVPKALIRAIKASSFVLRVIGLFALLGLVISISKGHLSGALYSLAQVHVQAVIILLVAITCSLAIGPRRAAWIFFAMAGISCAFGIAQWLGVGPAWSVRDYLGLVYTDPLDASLESDRSPGLAFSTIYLAGQSCMLFAIALIFYRRWHPQKREPGKPLKKWFSPALLLVCLAGVVLVNIAGGNRSPLLGLVLFLGLFVIGTKPTRWMITVPIVLFGVLLIGPLQEFAGDVGLRVGSSADKSVSARDALFDYGWQIFTRDLWGYGLTFDSTQFYRLGDTNFGAISLTPGLDDVFARVGLHNYPLTMLNRYGVLGVFLCAWVLRRILRQWKYALLFVPYFVHTLYHNLGPLDSDFVIWFPIGLCIAHWYLEPLRRGAQEVQPSLAAGPKTLRASFA